MELEATLAASSVDATIAAPSYLTRVLPPGATIGRYVLLARLGAGAMGVVHAAHDPELDRRVALKLVARARDGSRARLLREAQALARLTHPNVVAVHDVGTHDGLVFIAMEFVDGVTLSAWAREAPRSQAEVLRVLADVARGVAAAHAAGLVHRDLKPDNVMIDRAGRVRVMDFGLAHGRLGAPVPEDSSPADLERDIVALSQQLTAAGAIQGTPAYMAPEQWQGREAAAPADQFSWCVMAWELLHGQRPFPGDSPIQLATAVTLGRRLPPPRRPRTPAWLRRVLERGLAVDPARRWPGMDELLAALRRGRARARLARVLLALAALALVALAALAARRWQHERTAAACDVAGAAIDEVWSDEARARITAALTTTTVERVTPWFDQQAAAWRTARATVCRETELHARWDAATRDRSLWCLEDRRLAISALIDELAHPDPRVALRAVTAAAALPRIDPCVDLEHLRRQPTPPIDRDSRSVRRALARAESLRLAGKPADALAAAREARDEADAFAWPPLLVAADLLVARLIGDTGDLAAAEAATADGYFAAARIDAWDLAADAATQLVHLAGNRRGDLAEGILWARSATLAIDHAGDRAGLREASRDNALANAHAAARRYEEARALHARALEIRRTILGPDHPDVAWNFNNLALDHAALGDRDTARDFHTQALGLRRRVLGPDHPDVAFSLYNLASLLRASGDLDAARDLHEQALAIRERVLGPQHPDVAHSYNNLALVHADRGDYPEARRLHSKALALREHLLGPDHPDVAASLDNLGLVRAVEGAHADARDLHARALALREKILGPDHPDVAATSHNLALALSRLGDHAAAERLQLRALTTYERTFGPDHPRVRLCLVERGLALLALDRTAEALPLLERAVASLARGPAEPADEARIRFALAQAIVTTDPARARVEATRARDLRPTTHPLPELAGLDTFLAARAPASIRHQAP